MKTARYRDCALACLVAFLLLAASATGLKAEDRGGWSITGFGGVMTDNDWQYALIPLKVDLVDSHLVGAALGYEWTLPDDRWTLGFEAQVVRHFGRQDHFEANLPAILRYHPRRPWPRRLQSLAFGIGISHAFELPQVEIDRNGASRHNLVYWMAEAEFATARRDLTWLFRLHHRSDAFGLLEPPTGSNAIVFGLRHSF